MVGEQHGIFQRCTVLIPHRTPDPEKQSWNTEEPEDRGDDNTDKMVVPGIWAAALFANYAAAQAGKYPPDVVDKLAESSLPKLKAWLEKNPQGSCTYETAIKRKEW